MIRSGITIHRHDQGTGRRMRRRCLRHGNDGAMVIGAAMVVLYIVGAAAIFGLHALICRV